MQLNDIYLGSKAGVAGDVFVLPDSGGNEPGGLRGLLSVAALKARRVSFYPEHRIFAWNIQWLRWATVKIRWQAPHSGPGTRSDILCGLSVTDTALRIFILNNAVSPRGN